MGLAGFGRIIFRSMPGFSLIARPDPLRHPLLTDRSVPEREDVWSYTSDVKPGERQGDIWQVILDCREFDPTPRSSAVGRGPQLARVP